MNKKIKRIAALIGVVLLVGIYLTTLVCALIQSEFTQSMLMFSVFGTFFVPIVIFAMNLMTRVLSGKQEEEVSDEQK